MSAILPLVQKALVTVGKGQMPAWGGVLNEPELNQLWEYIQAHAR